MVEQKSDGAETASDADIVALKPGTRIGRHEVLAVLGQGGFGITYRASDGQLHRDVAIKEYLPTLLAYRSGGTTVMPRSTKVAEDFAWGRDRFVAEGRTLASLHHAPGIVRVFDFLETNGTAYIVMEMLRGDTLEARIKAGPPLDGAEVERILRTLLDGLEQVHDAGFLHRDIKPANILLDHRGNPTLIDFGASRAAMTGRTVAMTAIFTPGYAATEQMTSAKQGPWTDIYGLSATLYHAIAGEPPPNAFDRLLDDEYKPLSRLAPQGFPPGLIAGIDAGLAVRASDRPQSIAGWRALLSMSAAGAADATQLSPSRSIEARTMDPDATMLARTPTQSPPPASPSPSTLSSTVQPAPPAPPPSAQPPKSRAPLYAGVAAAVLLLAGGGGYLALSSLSSPSSSSKPEPPQAVVLQDLKVEDLERALAERRAADAAAAEKRRLEEEAQRKAEADAAAKQAADAELVKAEAARKAAEEELARLKSEIEARRQEAQNEARRAEAEAAQRKAEAEMAALRRAEEDARRKAAAEAESKRLADEALARAQAERLRTEEEAQKKAAAEKREKADATARQIAEAEAQEKAKAQAAADAKAAADAEAAARKAAETAEAGLRLGLPERQKVQVALSSLGFDTRGNDGALGPRSREMIAAWQKARNRPATGFLDGAQHEALTREASAALQKYDADQQKADQQKKEAEQKKKAEDEKKAAEEAARAKAAKPTPTPAPAAPAPSASTTTAAAPAPAGEARWTGTFKCDLWPGTGVPIVIAPVNGQFSQRFSGRNGTVVAIAVSGNMLSGSVTWRPRIGEKTLTGSFSATLRGNSVAATTISRSDFKGGPGPDESQCALTLSKAGG